MGLVPEACAEQGQVPAGYYDAANRLCGAELKVALSQITQKHEVFSYGSLWYHYELTDVVPGTDNQVFDYYSPRVYYFTGVGTAPTGANKEHCCPQSWWGGGASSNCFSDLFNVYPSDVDANAAKSNYPLGVVGSSVTFSNGCMKVGRSARADYDGTVFEPCDDYKGDFARIYFYVATTYAWTYWGINENVAHTVAFTQQDYPTLKPWVRDLLLQWNAQDPVSDWEIIRNERVYQEQHNRNPFIDYPQLADHIWGDKTDVAFSFADALVNGSATGGTGNGHHEGGDTPSAITEALLADDFSSVDEGNDMQSSGSSAAWSGNDNFPEVSTVYQAGGAVRMGSSKNVGRLVSRPLGNEAGADLSVEVYVKGWTNVEGQLIVGVTGKDPQAVTYTATMSDDYEMVLVTFHDCPADAVVTLSTSSKRCFLTSVRIGKSNVGANRPIRFQTKRKARRAYTLSGQPAPADFQGFAIRDRKVSILLPPSH